MSGNSSFSPKYFFHALANITSNDSQTHSKDEPILGILAIEWDITILGSHCNRPKIGGAWTCCSQRADGIRLRVAQSVVPSIFQGIFGAYRHARPVQTETQFNPTFQIVAIAVGDKLRTILSL